MGFLQRAVALGVDERTPLQAALLSGAAAMAAGSGRPGQAADLAERGLEIAAAVADHRHRGRCLAWAAHRWFFSDFGTCHEMAGEAARWGALADDPFVVDQSAVLRARAFTNRDRHAEAVAEIGDVRDRAQARGERCGAAFALAVDVWAALFTGDVREAVERGREALALAEPLGDHFTVGHMTFNLAWATALSGDLDAARALIDPVIRSVTAADPELLRWFALVPGRLELWRGDLAAARHWLEIASRFAEPATDNWHVAQVLPALAGTLRRLGRPEEAREVADRAAALAGTLDVPHARAEALDELGHLARDGGRRAEAEELYRRALALRVEHDLRTFWPDSFDALGGVGNDPVNAVRLLAAADAGRAAVGRALPPVDREPHQATVAGLRAALGPEAFDSAWSAGAQLTLGDAVAYVIRSRGGRRTSGTGWESLTPVERQVVELIVAGRSNPEIGARLFMSRSTVKTHLGHVYAKLGVANRAELAAVAGRQQGQST
jgi:ATP/maltotriose-dependent transcriptional regulator MalT